MLLNIHYTAPDLLRQGKFGEAQVSTLLEHGVFVNTGKDDNSIDPMTWNMSCVVLSLENAPLTWSYGDVRTRLTFDTTPRSMKTLVRKSSSQPGPESAATFLQNVSV